MGFFKKRKRAWAALFLAKNTFYLLRWKSSYFGRHGFRAMVTVFLFFPFSPPATDCPFTLLFRSDLFEVTDVAAIPSEAQGGNVSPFEMHSPPQILRFF